MESVTAGSSCQDYWPVRVGPASTCADYSEGIVPNAASGGGELAPRSWSGCGKLFAQSRETAQRFRRIGRKRRLRGEWPAEWLGDHSALELVEPGCLPACGHARQAAGIEIDDPAFQTFVGPASRLWGEGRVNLWHEARLRLIGDSEGLRMHCTYALVSLAITVVERNSNRTIEMSPSGERDRQRVLVHAVPHPHEVVPGNHAFAAGRVGIADQHPFVVVAVCTDDMGFGCHQHHFTVDVVHEARGVAEVEPDDHRMMSRELCNELVLP